MARSAKSTGTIDAARDVVLVDVELLEQRGEEGSGFERERVVGRCADLLREALGCAASAEYVTTSVSILPFGIGFEKFGQVFPEQFAAVDDLAAAHVEEIDGDHVVFVVVAEDVGLVAVGGGDALLVLHLIDGDEQVAILRGELELLGGGGLVHALLDGAAEFGLAALEKHLRVADGLAVDLGSGEAFDAGAEAALDVVLQAGARVIAREVDLAAGQAGSCDG